MQTHAQTHTNTDLLHTCPHTKAAAMRMCHSLSKGTSTGVLFVLGIDYIQPGTSQLHFKTFILKVDRYMKLLRLSENFPSPSSFGHQKTEKNEARRICPNESEHLSYRICSFVIKFIFVIWSDVS